jgi:hypothetical protein
MGTRPLETGSDITDRITRAFDPAWHNSVQRRMRYAYGEPFDGNAPGAETPGKMPWFEDIAARTKEVGRSMRILQTCYIALSKTVYGIPEPKYPQVHKFDQEVRTQAWLARYEGANGCDDEWEGQFNLEFLEGNGLGVGYVQHGFKRNPETGLMFSTVEHCPTLFCIGDRHVRGPARARHWSVVKYLDVDDAVEMLRGKVPEHDVRAEARPIADDTTQLSFDVVRVVEYYSKGIGGCAPTRALIPTDIDREPWLVEANPFGSLPRSFYLHLLPPGFRYPIGLIDLQMATQEEINRVERSFRETLEHGPVDLVQTDMFEEGELKKWETGKSNRLRMKRPTTRGDVPIARTPGSEIRSSEMAYYQMLIRQNNEETSSTDAERGQLSLEKRTLGEVQLAEAKSAPASNWTRKQTLNMFRRAVERFGEYIPMDKDPLILDVFGSNIPINNPSDPMSWLSKWFEEYSRVVIAESSLEEQDYKAEQFRRSAELDTLAFLTPTRKWQEEKVKAIGEDPSDWLPEETQAQSGVMGGPMQAPGIPPMQGAPAPQLPAPAGR